MQNQVIFYKYRFVSEIYKSTLSEVVKLENHADIQVTTFQSNWQWLNEFLENKNNQIN